MSLHLLFRFVLCTTVFFIGFAEVRAEFGDYRSIFVDRFDFPYSGGSIASHTATINQMMQDAADEGFSEVIWQVRGRADALYNSNFEPYVTQMLAITFNRARKKKKVITFLSKSNV